MIWKGWIYIMFLFLMIYSFSLAFEDTIGSEDWNRYHSKVVADFSKGVFNASYTDSLVLNSYPHVFHAVMIPFQIISNFMGISMAWVQVVLALIVNAVLFWSVRKQSGYVPMLVLSVLMLSNIIFLMYYSSLTPQTLDIILFPMFFYFMSREKYFTSMVLLVLMGYSHLFGMVFYFAALIFALIYRKPFIKFWIVALILLLPAITGYYLPTFTGEMAYSGSEVYKNIGYVSVPFQIWNTAETLYFVQPLNLLMFSGFCILLIPYVIYKLRKQFKLTLFQQFCIIWLLAFIPTLYFNFLRGWSYMLVPLMLLEASVFKDEIL